MDMQEIKKDTRISVNAEQFEKLTILTNVITERMDFKRKFRVVLEHDPEKKGIEIKYYYED